MSKKPYFSPYSKPYKPQKPPEKINTYEKLSEVHLSNDCTTPFVPVKGATDIGAVVEGNEHDGYSVLLAFFKKVVVDNPNYAKQLELYDKAYVQYKIDLKEWNVRKKEWDKEQVEARRRQFEKLKKEFNESRPSS